MVKLAYTKARDTTNVIGGADTAVHERNCSMQNELIEYVQCPLHDVAMLQWYGQLCAAGDIGIVIPRDVYTLSKFFEYLQPLKVVFKGDDAGIWFVGIFTSMFVGAQFDMWVRPERRKGKAWVEAMCETLEWGFAKWSTLIGLTSQENLLDDHVRMGYTVAGKVPHLWDGTKDLWIMYVTKESFDMRETFVIRRKAG